MYILLRDRPQKVWNNARWLTLLSETFKTGTPASHGIRTQVSSMTCMFHRPELYHLHHRGGCSILECRDDNSQFEVKTTGSASAQKICSFTLRAGCRSLSRQALCSRPGLPRACSWLYASVSRKNSDQVYSLDYMETYIYLQFICIIIIIYHDFLPTPRRGSHVKSGKTHTQSSRYTP